LKIYILGKLILCPTIFYFNNIDSTNIDYLLGKKILVKWEKKAAICSDKSIDGLISGDYYIKITKKCEKTDSFAKKPDYSFIDTLDDSEIYNTIYLSKIDSISSAKLKNADSLSEAILNEIKKLEKCNMITMPKIHTLGVCFTCALTMRSGSMSRALGFTVGCLQKVKQKTLLQWLSCTSL